MRVVEHSLWFIGKGLQSFKAVQYQKWLSCDVVSLLAQGAFKGTWNNHILRDIKEWKVWCIFNKLQWENYIRGRWRLWWQEVRRNRQDWGEAAKNVAQRLSVENCWCSQFSFCRNGEPGKGLMWKVTWSLMCFLKIIQNWLWTRDGGDTFWVFNIMQLLKQPQWYGLSLRQEQARMMKSRYIGDINHSRRDRL